MPFHHFSASLFNARILYRVSLSLPCAHKTSFANISLMTFDIIDLDFECAVSVELVEHSSVFAFRAQPVRARFSNATSTREFKSIGKLCERWWLQLQRIEKAQIALKRTSSAGSHAGGASFALPPRLMLLHLVASSFLTCLILTRSALYVSFNSRLFCCFAWADSSLEDSAEV